MEVKLMKKAAIWCLCFTAAATGIIIYLSFQKNALAAQAEPAEAQMAESGSGNGAAENSSGTSGNEESEDQTGANPAGAGQEGSNSQGKEEAARAENSQAGDGSESGETLFFPEGEEKEYQKLTFSQGEPDTSYLRVPLPNGCRAEDISIENYYMDQELWILIESAESGFYAENAISGNQEKVRQGIYEEDENGIKLRFKLTGIFEYRTILENNELYISFLNPQEVYEQIVVIDPACGGLNTGYAKGDLKEKEINLAIAEKLRERLEQTDIKVYYTRMDDVNPAKESRIRLANETRADLYIRIALGVSEDGSVYGTAAVYNEDYFIPGFGNAELAQLLEEEVVSSIKGKALELEETEETDDILKDITVPAAIIKAGCVTNKQEATLLVREEYQDKIAAGIYNAILKAYEEKEG